VNFFNLESTVTAPLRASSIDLWGTSMESTTLERATKESRKMSAATKGRGDKKARRRKSAATKQRETNNCDKTVFQKLLGPYR
jgi:hypothetical protein